MNSLQLTSSEEFVASRISKSPTGRIRLRESIPERKTMQRALHFARYVDDCVTFVRSERAGKRVMEFSITRDRLPLDLFLPDQPNRHLRPCLGIARQGVDWTRTSGGVGGAPREGRPYPDLTIWYHDSDVRTTLMSLDGFGSCSLSHHIGPKPLQHQPHRSTVSRTDSSIRG